MNKYLLTIVILSSLLHTAQVLESAEETTSAITLRTECRNLSISQVYSMASISIRKKDEWGFYGHSTIRHSYEAKSENGVDVVVDHATGLMWIQSGSDNYMKWHAAKELVKNLNSMNYAGYSDWRLPTLDEAVSLLEPTKSNALYIDPVFDGEQWGIWSCDKHVSGEAWSVYFSLGNVRWRYKNRYVRPVRSIN
ncbi:MAG: DUF1566 domain-containing protein [Candidatus Scalindua sp. AMX11]|nr:MAG: DUF1566 domain-containing protein [Candidatus Scalindua sp.]NOG83726.1 DUF1566 domain-containing protein [Planctomycetota bacterium]RZV73825.1 MAG: DUF1566 domain-containing protein [Candidatus Scalindua sp. SCAELEC01]TDE64831.1 MAG: DUF1566 domain-containing protein [Candidatus Scalindua sp. AMX11]GJQ60842.1 MAG: hypothetical protein SCALA701_36430 [Candidatus Scalindua sp.]